MGKFGFTVCALLVLSTTCHSQLDSQIVAPPFNDRYSQIVRALESGNAAIDFQDFRYSFLESRQFVIAGELSPTFDSLEKEMYTQIKSKQYSSVLSLAKRLLNIDYTNMSAHKVLSQTYRILGDTVNSQKYRTIELGLLRSIVSKRDGNSVESAWPVIQLSEEYFILQMLDARLKKQSTVTSEGIFDKMQVEVEGREKVYYFEVSKVFEGYKRRGLN